MTPTFATRLVLHSAFWQEEPCCNLARTIFFFPLKQDPCRSAVWRLALAAGLLLRWRWPASGGSAAGDAGWRLTWWCSWLSGLRSWCRGVVVAHLLLVMGGRCVRLALCQTADTGISCGDDASGSRARAWVDQLDTGRVGACAPGRWG